MAATPIVVVLYDRVFAFSTLREAMHARKYLYSGLAATWAGLGALIWLWPRSTVGFAAGVDSWTYALNQAQLIPRYLHLALWPDALVLDYGLPKALALGDVTGSVLVVGALLGGTIVTLVRWPMIGFLPAAFFLTLAPSTSIIPIVSEVGAERRMYLPLAAVAVLLVLGGRYVLARVRSFCQPNHRRMVTATALAMTVVWLALFAVRTAHRNSRYADPVSLWRTSVERAPHGRSRMSYATALVKAGQPDVALPELREAVRDYPDARYALGTELAVRGENAAAIPELERFIADAPAARNRLPARLLLGRLYVAEGRLEDSARQSRSMLELAPSSIDAHASLADVLVGQRRYGEAASHYRAMIALQPDRAEWQIRLGRALDLGGELESAVDAYRTALRMNPASRIAHLSLADVYLRLDRVGEAIVHARESVRLESDGAAHNLLGTALARDGHLDEALEHFQTALTLDPGNEQAGRNLSRATSLLGYR